ncbi:hypothetical protein CALVIDRAFT_568724 [Calocera viscosa TUFC12733]|uniref:Uncharacterized protein n=1 Tax=Calocera viscosa (strain TUFC12733) TaxID=1330018 RepID=A0A167GS62_CALVF|nr:hypothetical protein CALVIDRAFT_568724 [Calocera viscosa TUFC12733]
MRTAHTGTGTSTSTSTSSNTLSPLAAHLAAASADLDHRTTCTTTSARNYASHSAISASIGLKACHQWSGRSSYAEPSHSNGHHNLDIPPSLSPILDALLAALDDLILAGMEDVLVTSARLFRERLRARVDRGGGAWPSYSTDPSYYKTFLSTSSPETMFDIVGGTGSRKSS